MNMLDRSKVSTGYVQEAATHSHLNQIKNKKQVITSIKPLS